MMLTGDLPFQGHDDYTTVMKIMDSSYRVPESISRECEDLLSKLLVKDCTERITMDKVLQHPWLAGHRYNTEKPTERPKLAPDEHERISCIMEDAGISRESIVNSLKNNAFDYVASTYFLLAEKEVKLMRSFKVIYKFNISFLNL